MRLINIDDEVLQKNLSVGGKSAKQIIRLFYNQPMIDAIPVEWINDYKEKENHLGNSHTHHENMLIDELLEDWKKENK